MSSEPICGCYDRRSDADFPEWWIWELSFTGHVELRMEQRGVTELDLRAIRERVRAVVNRGRTRGYAASCREPWQARPTSLVRGMDGGLYLGLRHYVLKLEEQG